MKKNVLLLIALLSAAVSFSQSLLPAPKGSVKWAPAGLIAGDVSLHGEYSVGKRHSLTANIGIPVSAHHTFQYEDNDADFNMKAFSAMAGYRMYLSKKRMSGFYIEPYLKYVQHSSNGVGSGTLAHLPVTMNLTNEYRGTGIGAQSGAQFIIARRLVIDLFFLGPEINRAQSQFKAVETSSTIPWTYIEADEAEKDVRDFIDQFPFVKNNTTVKVDKNNRTVTADFKGALPGVKAGISFGIAF